MTIKHELNYLVVWEVTGSLIFKHHMMVILVSPSSLIFLAIPTNYNILWQLWVLMGISLFKCEIYLMSPRPMQYWNIRLTESYIQCHSNFVATVTLKIFKLWLSFIKHLLLLLFCTYILINICLFEINQYYLILFYIPRPTTSVTINIIYRLETQYDCLVISNYSTLNTLTWIEYDCYPAYKTD